MNEYIRTASAGIYGYIPRGQLHMKFLLPAAGLSLVF